LQSYRHSPIEVVEPLTVVDVEIEGVEVVAATVLVVEEASFCKTDELDGVLVEFPLSEMNVPIITPKMIRQMAMAIRSQGAVDDLVLVGESNGVSSLDTLRTAVSATVVAGATIFRARPNRIGLVVPDSSRSTTA
jgi:hypothetical protein